MTKLKRPTSFDEQIKKLEGRGLIIEDEERAKFILSNLNYYRFTAYVLPFKLDDDNYVKGTSFKKIYNIYMFDKSLRLLLMDIEGTVEISFRTYIAYTLAMKYGAYGYTDKRNFINEDYHNKFLLNLELEKQRNSSKLFIMHHNEIYEGRLPIWVATEIMPFGMLSKLYSNLLPGEKTFIKNNFCKVNVGLVNSWLQSLTHLRNECAHYGRVYNSLFPVVKIMKKHREYDFDNRKVFIHIVIIKYLVADQKNWNDFFISLQQLVNQYQNYIDLKLIGFPDNWVEVLSKI